MLIEFGSANFLLLEILGDLLDCSTWLAIIFPHFDYYKFNANYVIVFGLATETDKRVPYPTRTGNVMWVGSRSSSIKSKSIIHAKFIAWIETIRCYEKWKKEKKEKNMTKKEFQDSSQNKEAM